MRFGLPVLLGLLVVHPVAAQSAAAPAHTGAILVAHGAGREWNAQVKSIVAQARLDGPIEIVYLMGPEAPAHRFQDAVAKLDAKGTRDIVVVPLLVSSHSGHYEQIRWLAGLTDSLTPDMREHLHHAGHERATTSSSLRVSRALDDSPAMAAVLAERGRALVPGDVSRRALFLVGHGPNSAEDHAAWMENLRRVADTVKRLSGFGDVRVEVVRDDAPPAVRREAVTAVRELIEMQYRITGDSVAVVPVLISRGRVSREKFLADLAGLPVIYSGDPLLPHPALARWLEARVDENRRVAVVEGGQAGRRADGQ